MAIQLTQYNDIQFDSIFAPGSGDIQWVQWSVFGTDFVFDGDANLLDGLIHVIELSYDTTDDGVSNPDLQLSITWPLTLVPFGPFFFGSALDDLYAVTLDIATQMDQYLLEGTVGANFAISGPGGPTRGTYHNDVFIIDGVSDIFYGKNGDDFMRMDYGDGNLRGQAGNDYIEGSFEGNDDLRGGRGDDTLIGGYGGDDTLRGGSGNDLLFGGDGNDVMLAGNGTDLLIGTGGRDRMKGGADADTFYFFDGIAVDPEAGAGAGQAQGRAVIADFDLAEDQIWLDATVLSGRTGAESLTEFLSHAAQNGDDVVYETDAFRIIIRDVDIGDLTADHFFDDTAGTTTENFFDIV